MALPFYKDRYIQVKREMQLHLANLTATEREATAILNLACGKDGRGTCTGTPEGLWLGLGRPKGEGLPDRLGAAAAKEGRRGINSRLNILQCVIENIKN